MARFQEVGDFFNSKHKYISDGLFDKDETPVARILGVQTSVYQRDSSAYVICS